MVGRLVEKIRTNHRVTLKVLSGDIGFDPAYISRIETGKVAPSENFINKFCEYFGIETGTEMHRKLSDEASIAKAKIPEYVMKNEEVVDMLPIFFRTMTGGKVEDAELDKLIALIQRNNGKNEETHL